MRLFLRRSSVGREPLAVAMSGVRMGERLLQIGLDDPLVAGALAAKPGLSGDSAHIVSTDDLAVRARRAAEDASAAVTIRVHPLDRLPFDDGAFDVAVVHDRDGLLGSLGAEGAGQLLDECRRVLRVGGRIVLMERGSPTGLSALLGKKNDPEVAAHQARHSVERAGFRSFRMLGDRDGYLFVEAMRVADRP